MKTIFILFVINTLILAQQQNIQKVKNTTKTKDYSYMEIRIVKLEHQIKKLEERIRILEQKLKKISNLEDLEFRFISKEVIKTKDKEVVKIDATLTNNTPRKFTLIFGQIIIIDPYTQLELYSDNFYYEKPLYPNTPERIILAVPSTHTNYQNIKNLQSLVIKFNPKVIK